MEDKIGIWLDLNTAFIVYLKDLNGKFETRVTKLRATIPSKRAKGGARSKVPWGPMHKVAEDKLLDKRKARIQEFMKSIIEEVKKGKYLYIFGPSFAKTHLRKAIIKDHSCKIDIVKMEVADQMTDNQKIEKVRLFYSAIK